jgi:CoA:oxalate CoA-transferase
MADAFDVPEVALDPLFLTNDLRVQNRPAMIEAIERVTRTAPVSVWLDKLNEAGVPCSPINTIDKVIEHPQLLSRNMFIQVEGKSGKTVKTAGNPIKMSTSPDEDVTVLKRAPAVDEHREAILAEMMASSGAYASQADTALVDEEPDQMSDIAA